MSKLVKGLHQNQHLLDANRVSLSVKRFLVTSLVMMLLLAGMPGLNTIAVSAANPELSTQDLSSGLTAEQLVAELDTAGKSGQHHS